MATAAAFISAPAFSALHGASSSSRLSGLAVVVGADRRFRAARRSGRTLLPQVGRGDRTRFPRRPLRQPAGCGSSASCILVVYRSPILVAAIAHAGIRRRVALGRRAIAAAISRAGDCVLTSLLGGMRATTFAGGAQVIVMMLGDPGSGNRSFRRGEYGMPDATDHLRLRGRGGLPARRGRRPASSSAAPPASRRARRVQHARPCRLRSPRAIASLPHLIARSAPPRASASARLVGRVGAGRRRHRHA